MKNIFATHTLLALALMPSFGCDLPEEGFADDEVALRPGSVGGIWFNTNKIGKHLFAEIDVTGADHDGVELKHVITRRGVVLDKVWAENGLILGSKGAAKYSYTDLVGSRWSLMVDIEGVHTNAQMVIENVTKNGPVFIYNWTETHDGGPKDPMPTCDEDPDHPGTYGSVITGDITVDTDNGKIATRASTIYIGCVSGGVGKAGLWGYPRHLVGAKDFEAAVRMVRADYCGNGVSFTVPGNPVEILDTWGYNTFPLPKAVTEAIWDTKGAACVEMPRHTVDWPSAKSVQEACAVMGARVPATCKPTDSLSTYFGTYWTKNP